MQNRLLKMIVVDVGDDTDDFIDFYNLAKI